MTLTLQPEVLRWARDRAGLDEETLAKKLKVRAEVVSEWEDKGTISFARTEKLAKATHTPFGYLFLKEPPDEKLPIQDFRTMRDTALRRPSPDLLETVHAMQRRQSWMREFLIEEGQQPLPFVGSDSIESSAEGVAARLREILNLTNGWSGKLKSWDDALRHLRKKIDAAEILVVINGVVGNDTRRKLRPEEFRGFALTDKYAPLIFVNGADAKSAQIFTLAHELAHILIGQSGVSNPDASSFEEGRVERFCNSVAAEFLVPSKEMRESWLAARGRESAFEPLARHFKVSPIVIARRAKELDLINMAGFMRFLERSANRPHTDRTAKGGGDFWNNQSVRVGERFGSAVVRAALGGNLLYRDAYALTGLSGATFDEFTKRLGFGTK